MAAAPIEHERDLRSFADAVARDSDDLGEARERLRAAAGDVLFVEACAVTAAFHGYVRVADGTGIPVDDLVMATSATLRRDLGADSFVGRANTGPEPGPRPASDFDPSLGTS